MYIIKNAFKSISRMKTRNILIMAIITVVVAASCIALSIKEAANEVQTSTLAEYSITVNITLDREKLQQNAKTESTGNATRVMLDPSFMNSIQSLTGEDVKKYAESEYVTSYSLSINASMNSDDLEKVSMEPKDNGAQGGNVRMMVSREIGAGDFNIYGYESFESMTEFVDNTYKLTDGEMIDISSTDNSCLISTELADQNDLNVGDTFTLVNPNNESEVYTFKITGIYEDTSSSNEFSMFSPAANKIITTYDSLDTIISVSKENDDTKLTSRVESSFNLTNKDAIELFTQEVKDKGLGEYYTVESNLDSFERSIAPLKNLSSFATTFLIIVLAIGGSILVILNMLNIRERKYEIGVLRAIGMSRGMVLTQFVIELLVITTIAIIIGSLVGSFTSVPIASNMLESQISAEQSASENSNFMGPINIQGGGSGPVTRSSGGGRMMNVFGNADVEYIDKINAVVDVKVLLQLILIGLGLTAISGTISMVFISRYTPLKLLSNRS